MAKLADRLSTLMTKPVTVSIIGVSNADNYAGTLLSVGEDFLELDGSDAAKTLIPLAAIAAVTHR